MTLHALGAAITKAVEIALHVQSKSLDKIVFEITTSTERLIDDIIPDDLDLDIEMEERLNSAIHIKLRKAAGP